MTDRNENGPEGVPTIGTTIAEPDFINTLASLNGGILPRVLAAAMADAALRVATVGDAKSKGVIAVELTFTQAKGQDALNLDYAIKSKSPTEYGERTEVHKDTTIVYCNRKGAITIAPERQGKLFDDK